MSSNNYFGFAHGGTQYGQAGSYQTTQTGYAVTPASYTTQRTGYETAYQPAATNSTPATAYAGTYGAVTAGATTAATYDYGYGRPAAAATYETPKTYYQQPAAATYSTTEYQQAFPTAAKPAYSTTSAYTGVTRQVSQTTQAKPAYQATSYQVQATQPVAATYSTAYSATQQQTATQTKVEKKPGKYMTVGSTPYQTQAGTQMPAQVTTTAAYSTNYTTPQVQPQPAAIQTTTSGTHWPSYKKPGLPMPGGIRKLKPAPKPQQIHYCDVCKISCGGPQTYREHLEGQKHKKKEAAAKSGTPSPAPGRHSNSLVCELCDVTCTGNDAYAAHIRGAKHQKVVKLHTKLGKPIPAAEPVVLKKPDATKTPAVKPAGATATTGTDTENTDMETCEPDIEPVGQDYIEELKSEEAGKTVFNCKLCECKFNDPNAKEMHMKGRRHRLQYKKKVDPQLVVDVKPSNKVRKLQEDRMRRQQQREDFYRQREEAWGRNNDDEQRGPFWDPRGGRPFDDPDMLDWYRRGPMGPPGLRPWGGPPPAPFFPMRRPDSSDDRHVINRHAAIYPKKEELDAVHKIVSHNEKALKLVSDFLTEEAVKKAAAAASKAGGKAGTAGAKGAVKPGTPAASQTPVKVEEKKDESKKVDGSDGTLFSFHHGKDETQPRALKGAMRVGCLAKGLLLSGDTAVDLVVLCAEKPTRTLLFKVAENLPKQLQVVAPDEKYMVQKKPEDAAITVMDTKEPHNTVTITLTSPLMREQALLVTEAVGDGQGKASGGPGGPGAALDGAAKKPVQKDPPDVLDKNKCLDALAALRHAKWFQARAHGLQSCVMVIRIIRDLCQRVPTWAPLNSWAMELLVEKVISSANCPLSLGDSLRRVMEAVSSGILLPGGPGLMDPCEKDAVDAVGNISSQQREDITASAQHALRLIAFRQIHKVLGMDPLPVPKFRDRNRFPRKRRREGSSGEGGEGGDGKKDKKEEATEK